MQIPHRSLAYSSLLAASSAWTRACQLLWISVVDAQHSLPCHGPPSEVEWSWLVVDKKRKLRIGLTDETQSHAMFRSISWRTGMTG